MALALETKQLLPPLGVLVVTAGLALTAGIMGYRFLDQEDGELNRTRAELASWEERLRQAEGDIQAMQRAMPRYQALKQKGVIGATRDTTLLANLGESARRYHLEQVKYQLGGAEVWRPDFSYDPGAFDLLISRLEINARAYHEEEMMDLLGSLLKLGLGTVGSCEFLRDGGELTPERASLSAQCGLVWFTLREKAVRQ